MTTTATALAPTPLLASAHEPWCDRAEHARYAADVGAGEAYCLSRYLTVTMAGGHEAGGWWTSPHGLPRFVVEQPFDAEVTPGGARALLAALEGATNPMSEGLRQLLTEALTELGEIGTANPDAIRA